jgi:hypothetical protein
MDAALASTLFLNCISFYDEGIAITDSSYNSSSLSMKKLDIHRQSVVRGEKAHYSIPSFLASDNISTPINSCVNLSAVSGEKVHLFPAHNFMAKGLQVEPFND